MKPMDKFIEQMLESARLVRSHDVGAATDVIHKALRDAGLMGAPAAPSQPQAQPDPQFAQPQFVDLNTPPPWSARPAAKRATQPRARRAPGVRSTDPGQFVDGAYTCAAGTRRYQLYIPANRPEGPRPLVVMLHGCTQHAADFAAGTTMNAAAERHGCLVLYPEQDRGANPNACWNWFETGHQGREAGEPAILAGMTRHVAAEQGIDLERVYAAGLSAGGAMAAILGGAYPDLFAAVGVHSGLPAGCARDMITGLSAMKQPRSAARLRKAAPVIVFHGDADAVVHPANGEAVLRQVLDAHGAGQLREERESLNKGGRRVTRTAWRNADGTPVAEHWLLHGAAHAWAGGSKAGSHTDASGPDASEEMLRFFLANGGR